MGFSPRPPADDAHGIRHACTSPAPEPLSPVAPLDGDRGELAPRGAALRGGPHRAAHCAGRSAHD
eukprot:CAMPEP_0206023832 /NCGR_PEP_ID=MMETSP1464-20131121/37153_1 /ASSEMBLY_ACC=CAM_ASM_001124 /TAXON_ID=119497 /ORGANISM="Exanthemachrysis gayraliae, Strain RCC1523" /LENGTH=64 /DNA_ID=CAMNT_0053397829 /DNA_START=126 /DNA_END=317 /DNA_ORIENTATION=+